MNDYARVRSKNEKKKTRENRQLSSFSLEASFLFGPSFRFLSSSFSFFFRFWFFLYETRRSKRTTKENKKKKKEKREKNRSAFDSLGSFQTTRGIKEGDARIEGASTRAETKKKRQRRGREKECPV